MSVLLRTNRGWFVDSRSLIDQGYTRCVRWRETQRSHVQCRFKRQCFEVSQSHYSVAAGASVDGGTTEMLPKTGKPPKKRKRKHSELNQGELDSQAFHEKVRSLILEGTKSLVDSVQTLGYLNGQTDTVKEPLPSQECRLAALCEMAKELPLVDDEEQECCSQSLVAEDNGTSHADLFSQLMENRTDCGAVLTLMGEEYVIPPDTAFLLSDFTRIQPLVDYGRRFDLIVMDPPWENKSVKRSRSLSVVVNQRDDSSYVKEFDSGALNEHQHAEFMAKVDVKDFHHLMVVLEEKSGITTLKRLPVPLLASPSCLVVTWVTNRPSHLRFVRDELYPHWGVEVVAEWFWVKVTTSGEFVFPLDSPHKKPYEILVLGRYRPSVDASTSPSDTSELPVEDQQLIVSVPSALHSQKPSLSEVLKPYVGAKAESLELFARNLLPGWISWGNEVLKFQHTSYFTVTPADDGADVSKDKTTETQVSS